MTAIQSLIISVFLLFCSAGLSVSQELPAAQPAAAASPDVGVAAQYDSTHVYVTADDFDRFVASVRATFGGTTSKRVVTAVTPTSSSTISQVVLTPVGTFSVFGYKTPIPYPFGAERTGNLVTDMDMAVRRAREAGAYVLVTPFDDPIGRDTIIQFPGGVNMQFYVHTTAPSYKPLEMAPENRVYLPSDAVDTFVRSFIVFSSGKLVSNDEQAPGIEVGRPSETYRRVRVESTFGKLTVLATDGHLPYPYGRETTGYEVTDLAATLAKAKNAGIQILVGPYKTGQRDAAMVQFPGGYIAEVHSAVKK